MVKNKAKRFLSTLLSFILLLGMGAANLQAAPGDVIDPTKDVSLTVKKYLTTIEPDGSIPADGYTDPLTTNNKLKPAKGVEFTLTKLKNVGPDTSITDYTPDTFSETKTTDDDGLIVWDKDDGLTQGYYLLVETKTPYNGEKNTDNPDGIYASISTPSIISLPFGMQNADGSANYNYDVKVYPKNVGDINHKTVLDQNNLYKPGDSVVWNIQTFINSQLATKYVITDDLDERLDFEGVSVYLVIAGEDPADTNKHVPLIEGEDYSVVPSTQTADGPLVTITLTPDGLEKAKDNNAATVYTNVNTKINNKAMQIGKDDVIVNNAEITFSNSADASEEKNMGIPTSATVTLASIELELVDKDKNPITKDVEGTSITFDAKNGGYFKIAMTEEDAREGKFLQKDGTSAVDGDNDFVLITDKDGKAYASGLPYTDYLDDGDGNIEEIYLYLVQTQAPKGYKLNTVKGGVLGLGIEPAVIKFTLEQQGTETTEEDPTDSSKSITYYRFFDFQQVINYTLDDPDGNGNFSLPKTGGAGTIMFTLGGLALITTAGILFLKTKRRKEGEKTPIN